MIGKPNLRRNKPKPEVKYVQVPTVVSQDQMFNLIYTDLQDIKAMLNALLAEKEGSK